MSKSLENKVQEIEKQFKPLKVEGENVILEMSIKNMLYYKKVIISYEGSKDKCKINNRENYPAKKPRIPRTNKTDSKSSSEEEKSISD